MKTTANFLIACLLPWAVLIAQTNIGGTIDVDSTLTLADSPYTVTTNLTVATGVTLTIQAGVTLQFNSGRRLYVFGTLDATETSFTSSEGTPTAGAWDYIQIGSSTTSGTATLSNCNYQYAEALWVENGSLTLSATDLTDLSQNGIYLRSGCSLNMSDGQLTGSGGSKAIYIYDGSFSTAVSLSNVGIDNWNMGLDITGPSAITTENLTIQNSSVGVHLSHMAASIDLDNATITDCSWPIKYSAAGSITANATTDLTGNDHDAVDVSITNHTNHLILPTLNVPYLFYNNFTVENGAVLEIASDNILKFKYHNILDVRGTLIARAAVDESIYFTSDRDDNWGGDTNGDGTTTAPSVSNWYGVKFEDQSVDSASVMRRCKIRYAGYYSSGGITMNAASPTIDSCDISYNYYGLRLDGDSKPVLSNNLIGSSTLTPIAMSFEADPVMTNNTLSFADNEYDAIGLLGGTLTADAVLSIRSMTDLPNMTYLMLSSITVPADRSLTINKGIVIKSIGAYNITVQGTFIADATADSMITFTSVRDDNYGNPGDTNKDGSQTAPSLGNIGGIVFQAGSDANSIIDHCRFNYAHTGHDYAVIAIQDADPTISYCEINNVYRAISCYQAAEPHISNNTITNTQPTYTPFAIEVSSNPVFTGNSFVNTGLVALGLLGGTLNIDGAIHQKDLAGYSNITYVLLSTLTVGDNSELVIDPGVIIKMDYSTSIVIDGGLAAIGTPDEKIIFTSYKDDNVGNPMDTNGDGTASSPSAGNWNGVWFKSGSDDDFSEISYCEFRYGGYSWGTSAAVRLTNAAPTITHSIIDKSAMYGLMLEGISNPTIDDLRIQNCVSDPIAMSIKSNPDFSNISFSGNASQGLRLLEGTLSSDATLSKRNLAGINNIAYIINSLTVNTGVILTIDPGVVLKISGNINVNGALAAVGMPQEKIIFTSYYDDSAGGDTNDDGNLSTPSAGNWGRILFNADGIDSVNVLKHCNISYGDGIKITSAYTDIDSCLIQQIDGHAVSTWGTANPDIRNCGIYNITGYYGFAFGIFNSSSPVIHNCEILNVANAPINMHLFANPVFSGNTIMNVGKIAIELDGQTLSQTDTIPQRNFAGYENITYVLRGNMTINSGTTITIPAGTVFKDKSFTVEGNIQVLGTESEPVIFTALDDDDYGNPGDTEQDGLHNSSWENYGLLFTNSSDDASLIEHAVLKYKYRGLLLESASPTVNHCLLQHLQYGFELNGTSAPHITGNTFQDLTKTPLKCSILAYPATTVDNVITGTTYRGIEIRNETLSQDVTLDKRSFAGINNIPYLFNSYTIGTGAVLTISPGVVCKFYNNGRLTVNKGLLALGSASADSNIVFTSIKDDFYGGDTNADSSDTSPNSNAWSGITFGNYSLAPYSELSHCIFRYAGNYTYTGAVNTNSASPTITHCSFNNNAIGILTNVTSNPVINYCDFKDNAYFGVKNNNGSYVINATLNWWGDNSGPTHENNPGGSGDIASDGVDYSSWLTANAENPLMGDVSLNGMVQAYDAALILQYSVGSLALDDAQLGVGDVSWNGSVTAFDAAYILQYAVGLISGFPAEELYKHTVLPGLTQAALRFENIVARSGETVSMPVILTRTGDLQALQLELQYDPELFENVSVEPAATLDELVVMTRVDTETGKIRLAAAGSAALVQDGVIARLIFELKDSFSGEQVTAITVDRFMANEIDLTGSAEPGELTVQGLPTEYALHPAYPNPFNPSTSFSYSLPVESDYLRISVFNVLGQEVTVLYSGAAAAGRYTAVWKGLDGNGEHVGNGVYFIRLMTGDFTATEKITLLR